MHKEYTYKSYKNLRSPVQFRREKEVSTSFQIQEHDRSYLGMRNSSELVKCYMQLHIAPPFHDVLSVFWHLGCSSYSASIFYPFRIHIWPLHLKPALGSQNLRQWHLTSTTLSDLHIHINHIIYIYILSYIIVLKFLRQNYPHVTTRSNNCSNGVTSTNRGSTCKRQIHRFLCVLEKWSSRINPTQKIKHSEFRSIHNFESVANTRATRFLMDLHAGVPLAACKLQLSFQLLGSFFEVPSPLGLLDNPAEKSQHEHATWSTLALLQYTCARTEIKSLS